MRTPIKDLRHVSKALPVLKTLIPPESKVETFLLFSGDLEINLAEAERYVTAHTTEIRVYDFWMTMFEDPGSITDYVKFYYPFPDQDVFNVFQKTFNQQKNPSARAALFFLLNRCSDLGTISSGNFEQSNFNPLALSYIKRFKKNNFDVKLDKDLIEALNFDMEADFVFIPAGKFNYSFFQEGMNTGDEQTRFDHEDLRDTVSNLKIPTIVLYSYHPKILEIYKDFDTKILIDKYGKITKDRKMSKEVLIANF